VSVRKPVKKFNYTIPAIFLVIIVVVAAALVIGGGESKPKTAKSNVQTTACGPYRDDKRVLINGQSINAEVATTTKARETGLSGRPCILPNQGMLFEFSTAGRYQFWMKDMKFPIDIVWISPAHKVAAIEIDFKPSTYPEVRANALPAQYVLELKANRSQELHMAIGTSVSF
jgi:uncharacterized membrane protein (UPF0127 family)